MRFNGYRRRKATLFVLLVLAGFLAGCSEKDGKDANEQESVADVTQLPKEEIVKKRAQEHMDAMIAMDWEKAYSYLSPARREILPYKVFVNRMKISAILRKKAEVKRVSCEGDVCEVAMDVTFMYMGGVVSAMQGKELTSVVNEKWVFAGQDWWWLIQF